MRDDRYVGAPPVGSPILMVLQELYQTYRDDSSGAVATYIPELAKVDPGLFGISLATFTKWAIPANPSPFSRSRSR